MTFNQMIINPEHDMHIEMEEIVIEKSISSNFHQHQDDTSQGVSKVA